MSPQWQSRGAWQVADVTSGIGSWQLTSWATSMKQREQIANDGGFYPLKACPQGVFFLLGHRASYQSVAKPGLVALAWMQQNLKGWSRGIMSLQLIWATKRDPAFKKGIRHKEFFRFSTLKLGIHRKDSGPSGNSPVFPEWSLLLFVWPLHFH